MGIGHGTGDNRAIEAARAAIDSPLLELSIDGAKGILFNITGGPDLGMYEIDEAAKAITEAADADANIIFGAIIDEAMQGEVKITVIATGFESEQARFANKKSFAAPETPVSDIPHSQILRRPERFISPPPPIQEEKPDEEDSEEIEVPAFIRRKLK
ncbi:MAG: Cell division protein FtsZ [bacterium ADurb.Bin400]|nr:MAG: Cell division protein FtsZ [bacterium ADurb.Bin400]